MIPTDDFTDPAWDILIDLFKTEMLGSLVGTTSACLAAHGPHTTALRYVSQLKDEGMIERHKPAHDGRLN